MPSVKRLTGRMRNFFAFTFSTIFFTCLASKGKLHLVRLLPAGKARLWNLNHLVIKSTLIKNTLKQQKHRPAIKNATTVGTWHLNLGLEISSFRFQFLHLHFTHFRISLLPLETWSFRTVPCCLLTLFHLTMEC